jgi:hypothetical protein
MNAPLRRIVNREQVLVSGGYTDDGDYLGVPVYRTVEDLECGHRVNVKVDIYGETNAERRRCKECAGSGRVS